MKKHEIEKALRNQEIEAVRRKNIGDYFTRFTRHHRPWMQELADKYKERGEFGVHSFVLADYYQKKEDQVIALFAALLIRDNGKILIQTSHLRDILTDEPYNWFKERGFVSLGLGRNQNNYIEGSHTCFWELSKLLERLWQIAFAEGKGLEAEVLKTMSVERCTAFSAMTYYLEDLSGVGAFHWKTNLLLIRLFRRNGLGLGLWGDGSEELLCPWNKDVSSFLETWFPDHRKYGNNLDCVKLFGLDDDIDFFYAYLCWKELGRRNPKKCSSYASSYYNWYNNAMPKKPNEWRKIMPEIEL